MPDDEKLTRIERILEVVDQGVSVKDFDKYLEQIINIIVEIERDTTQRLNALDERSQSATETIQNNVSTTLSDLKKQTNELFVGEKLKEMRDLIDKKLAQVKNGQDGVDGKDGKGERGPKGERGSPDTAQNIKQKLETLEGDERLDRSAIKGLDEMEKGFDRKISSIPRGGGGRASHSTKFYKLTPDGSTKIFTVPKSVTSIVLMSDAPNLLMENTGFTINGTRTQITLTVANAPSLGSQLLYQYSEMFNT